MRKVPLLVSAGLAVLLLSTSSPALASHRFSDVSEAHTFHDDISWLADAEITKGCGSPESTRFCPDNAVTRGQMAAFIVRAMGYSDTGGGDLFNDDDGHLFESDIDKMAKAGVTTGCNPPLDDRFCPDDLVTRGQMAAFIVRAMSYTDTGGGDLFIDDDGSTFETEIDKLGTAGVTLGCNPPANDRFCPDDLVTRGQMAAFMRRALAPPTDICGLNPITRQECQALIVLYDPAGLWRSPPPWITNTDMCTWPAVACEDGHVTELDYRGTRPKGIIPPGIGGLTHLKVFRLPGVISHVSGHIPAEIGNLTSLEVLYLGTAGPLTGPLPAEIGNLANLRVISIDYTDLTGPLPPEIGNLTHLEEMRIYGNHLFGGPIPPEIGGLTSLHWLDLANNALAGEVPTQLRDLPLVYLYLHGQSGCLYTHDAGFEDWLDSRNSGWNNGCS